MRNQSRRHQPRKTPLYLETFERRNLPSGMDPLLSPSLSSLLSSALDVVRTNEWTPVAFTTLYQAFAQGDRTLQLGLLNSPTGPTIGSTLRDLVQLKNAGSDQIGPLSDRQDRPDQTSAGSDASVGSDSQSPPTAVVQEASDNADTVSPITVVSASDTNGGQSGTTTATSGLDQLDPVSDQHNSPDQSSAGSDSTSTPTDRPLDSPATASDSVDSAGIGLDNAPIDNADTVAPTTTASAGDTRGDQSGIISDSSGSDNIGPMGDQHDHSANASLTTMAVSIEDSSGGQRASITGTIAPVEVSLDGAHKAPVGAVKPVELQAPGDANAVTPSAVDSYFSGPGKDSQRGGGRSLSNSDPSVAPEMTDVTPAGGDSSSVSRSGQENAVVGGTTNDISAPHGRAGVGDQANPVGNSTHNTAADAGTNAGRELNPTTGHDSSHGRTEEMNPPRPSFNVSTPGVGEARTMESTAGSDRLSSASNRHDRPDAAAVGSASKSNPTLFARQPSSLGLVPTDAIVEARMRPGLESPKGSGPERAPAQGPAFFPHTNEVEDSPVSASARGAGLLGSPLPFDLDSLAQEAQQFFEQVDQLSQDLASLLARMNVSPWAVGAAVAVTAIAVARRRLQRAQRGVVLDGCAFGCSSGLGAALDLSTVLAADNP
jgi:hypothetical protein